MQLIMFTKHLAGLDVPLIIDALHSAGMDGADLCVRDGYPVNPGNVESALPAVAKKFAGAALKIPLVTAPGDFSRPDIDYAERLYAACAEAGVRHIKLGYWHWRPGHPSPPSSRCALLTGRGWSSAPPSATICGS